VVITCSMMACSSTCCSGWVPSITLLPPQLAAMMAMPLITIPAKLFLKLPYISVNLVLEFGAPQVNHSFYPAAFKTKQAETKDGIGFPVPLLAGRYGPPLSPVHSASQKPGRNCQSCKCLHRPCRYAAPPACCLQHPRRTAGNSLRQPA